MKKILLLICFLLLTACSNNNVDKGIIEEKKIIELKENDNSNNKSENEMISNLYNRNRNIKSKIYKEYFFDYDLFTSGNMESDLKNGILFVKSSDFPVAKEYFSLSNYLNYSFDIEKEILNVAAIIKKGETINNKIIQDDILIHWVYDNKSSKLLTFDQEDIDGKHINVINFNEEQWKQIAKKYVEFSKKMSN